MASLLKKKEPQIETNLVHLCERYGISNKNMHSALSDCKRTWELYLILSELVDNTYFTLDDPFDPYSVKNRIKINGKE